MTSFAANASAGAACFRRRREIEGTHCRNRGCGFSVEDQVVIILQRPRRVNEQVAQLAQTDRCCARLKHRASCLMVHEPRLRSCSHSTFHAVWTPSLGDTHLRRVERFHGIYISGEDVNQQHWISRYYFCVFVTVSSSCVLMRWLARVIHRRDYDWPERDTRDINRYVSHTVSRC